jgi:hypothetical protein
MHNFNERDPSLLLQPDTRPISQEQLVNEVKDIYAGLVMVEKRCVEIDNQQATSVPLPQRELGATPRAPLRQSA